MRIPSIDNLMDHINDSRTKDSMNEVLSCFYSKNLRSAVVMLYATVVSDIYYKICDLVSLYNDAGAIEIKAYVEDEWKEHKTSPAWETDMPKKCHEKNKILKNDSYAHFCQLQTERNLCAHPVINDNNLYRPNFAKVQGLITDMLDEILCKPSFLSKNLIDTFTDDIESASKLFLEESKLQDYIKTKYLDKIDNESEEYDLFRRLWKFVFKNKDVRSNTNREANKSILALLYERHKTFFDSKIKVDSTYYGNSISLDDENCLITFIKYANEYTSIFKLMPKEFQLEFKQKVDRDIKLSALAFCAQNDMIKHVQTVNPNIGLKVAQYIFDYLEVNALKANALDFIINLYGSSLHFDDADGYFNNFIEPHLSEMSVVQLTQLIQKSNSNDQIYNRWNASRARNAIKKVMDSKNPSFDYSQYSNFM